MVLLSTTISSRMQREDHQMGGTVPRRVLAVGMVRKNTTELGIDLVTRLPTRRVLTGTGPIRVSGGIYEKLMRYKIVEARTGEKIIDGWGRQRGAVADAKSQSLATHSAPGQSQHLGITAVVMSMGQLL